jgi:hypothetical protein
MMTNNLRNLTKQLQNNYQDKHHMIVYVSNTGENCIFTTNDLNIDSQNKLVSFVS